MPKKFLFWLIAAGFSLNLASDFAVLRQSAAGRETGAKLAQNYEALHRIGGVQLRLARQRLPGAARAELRSRIGELIEFTRGLPDQAALAAQLAPLRSAEPSPARILAATGVLARMEAIGRQNIERGLHDDERANERALREMILANGAEDIALLLAAIAFGIYERRRHARTWAALVESLRQVESVNARLRSTMERSDSRFRATVHDLKNPLGSIAGFAEVLAYDARDPQSVVKLAGLIQQISDCTLTLVGAALTEQAGEAASPLDLPTAVRETCAFLEPVATRRGQTLRIASSSVPCVAQATSAELRNVLYNVLGNALKFSPAGTQVTVSFAAEAGKVLIQIQDEGPGFASADFPRLFQPGTPLTARPSGGEDSTGVGLYSVKQAMNAMEGSVEIANCPKRGACVTLGFRNAAPRPAAA